MRFLKWVAIVVTALTMVSVGYATYVVYSFDTETLPARHGKVQVKFFADSSSTQRRPLLVGLGGAEGRNAWASRRWETERQKFVDAGYAFLTIGYFGLPDTPENLDRIALEGIHAAITEAAQRPEVDGRCIAVMGVSKGAELALLLASRYPDIKAVAAIVPGDAVFVALTDAMTTSSFSHNGQALPFVPLPWKATLQLIAGNKRKVFDIMRGDSAAVAPALIPVERINGPVFFLSATEDEYWDSKGMSDAMMARLEAQQFPHATKHVSITGDHAAPTKRLDEVREFLAAHFKARAAHGCGTP